MTQFEKIKKLLHGNLSIYEDFDHNLYKNTLRPGSMPANEVLQSVVQQIKPSLIIEIGSYLGWSANGMATTLKEITNDGVIICVDTWMGGADHWLSKISDPDNPIQTKHGYPTFYYNFLANMCYANKQDTVIPFAYPSSTAAEILTKVFTENNLSADLIYVDGSHLALDVFYDCKHYYPLLRDGGIMFGDDWQCDDVKSGLITFCEENEINNLQLHPNGVHWFITKESK